MMLTKKNDITEETPNIRKISTVTEGRMRPNKRNDRLDLPRGSDGFILVLSGGCHYTFGNGTAFAVRAGDLLYLPNGSRYRMEISDGREDYSVIWVDFFFEGEDERDAVFVPSPDRAKTERTLRRLLSLSGKEQNLGGAEAFSLLYSLLAVFQSQASKEKTYLSPAVRKRLDEAYALLTARYADPDLRIGNVAAECGMSEVYLRKTFLRRFGMTPSEFLVGFRIAKAKALLILLSGAQPIGEIAGQCGFSEVTYFYRVFKKNTGLTPAEFVRQSRPKTN